MSASKAKTETNVLVLQGGGALGAYQGGAFEALEAGNHPVDWVAGISIGAINAALIAGNPPELRVERLRAFWDLVSSATASIPFPGGLPWRGAFNDFSAGLAVLQGVPGFFRPRIPPATLRLPGMPGADSLYDTRPLHDTLQRLVDFDYLNEGHVRYSTGAVNVETGNMTWFDSRQQTITPAHVMASGALPPSFPAVEIDGQFYWDGGLVSNTPLQFVLDQHTDDDLCIFQVDLFSARGPRPKSVWQIESRVKDIRFSSRTRFNTDMLCGTHLTRSAGKRLYDKLPPELRDDPDALALLHRPCDPNITIAHLIYRKRGFESQSRDYEFSRASVRDHWLAGIEDVETTLTHPAWHARHDGPLRVRIFDLTKERAEQRAAREAAT